MPDLLSALEAARPLLPLWVGPAGLVVCGAVGFAIGFATCGLGAHLAARPPRRLAPDAGWAERARRGSVGS